MQDDSVSKDASNEAIHTLSREQLLDQIEVLQSNLHKSAHYGSSLLSQIKQLQKKQSVLQSMHQNDNSGMDEMNMKMRVLEDQLDDLRSRIKEMTSAKIDADSHNDKLTEELHLLRIENEATMEKLERFRKMCSTFERERDELRTEKQKLERGELKKLRDERGHLRRKCEELERILRDRRSQQAELRREQQQSDTDAMMHLRDELNSLQNKLLQVKQEKVQLQSHNDSLRHQLEESVHILSTTKEEFRRYVDSVSGVVRENDAVQHSQSNVDGVYEEDDASGAGDDSAREFDQSNPHTNNASSPSLQLLEFEVVFAPTFLGDIKNIIHTIQRSHISFPVQMQRFAQNESDPDKALERLESFVIQTNQTLSKIEQETLEDVRTQLERLVDQLNAKVSHQTQHSQDEYDTTSNTMVEIVFCFIDTVQRLVNRTSEINSTMLQKTHQSTKLAHYKKLTETLEQQVDTLSKRHKELQEKQHDFSLHSHTIEKLRQNIASLEVNFQRQFASNEEEILTLQNENSQLRERKNKKIKNIKLEVQNLREQISRLEMMQTTSSQNEEHTKNTFQSIQDENETQAERIKDLEEALQANEELIRSLQCELTDRDSLLDEHVEEIKKLQQRLAHLSSEKENLLMEKHDVAQDAQQENLSMTLVERIVTNKCKVLNYSMLRSLSHLRFEVQTLRSDKTRSEQIIADLHLQLNQSKEQICQQALQNAVLCSSLNDLEQAYHNLRRSRFLL